MSPLRGFTIEAGSIPTTHVVGYFYIAPPGLRLLLSPEGCVLV
jgi:hypothetical protein